MVIIDEAHEQSKAIDLLLGLLQGMVKRRLDLKVIIMSATINAQSFLDFFPGAALKTVQGKTYDVVTLYLPAPPKDLIGEVVDLVLQFHFEGPPGNILVFVAGALDMGQIIKGVQAAGLGEDEAGPLDCYRLTAGLSEREQYRVAKSPPNTSKVKGKFGRKLIVATNVAETSVTITGVTWVIDTLQVNCKIWNCA